MISFTKKEKIVILLVILIIITSLAFKFLIKDKINPDEMIVEFGEIEENQIETEEDEVKPSYEDEISLEIMVHVSGQVYKPGIIILEGGKRLVDAIELAGGLKSNADLDRINLAKKLSDEEKIYIPEIGEEINPNIETVSIESDLIQAKEAGKININTCTKEELISLPGIGEVIATRVLEYRLENPFKSVDDIKSVSGIGDKKFEGIKDLIIN